MNPFVKTMLVTFGIIGAALIGSNYHANSAPLETVLSSTHKLHDGEYPMCSAVAISSTELITAAHCIPSKAEQQRNLNIRSVTVEKGVRISEKALYVRVDKVNYQTDVARLSILTKTEGLPSFTDLAPSFNPAVGTPMFAVGYPRGDVLTLTEGMFTSEVWLNTLGLNAAFYKATTPITGGSSGGGVYTKVGEEFFLVGLTTANWQDVSFQAYFSVLPNVQEIMP